VYIDRGGVVCLLPLRIVYIGRVGVVCSLPLRIVYIGRVGVVCSLPLYIVYIDRGGEIQNLLISREHVEAIWRYREYVQLAQNNLIICRVVNT